MPGSKFASKFKPEILAALSVLLALVLLSMLRRWDLNSETWDYWVPARIFGETGELPPADRAPLYAVYLQLFRWLGYPRALHVEYAVTTFIAAGALFAFMRKWTGTWTALFGAAVWIPYLQANPPPSQKLALALALSGLMLRRGDKKAGSYACFLLAQTFRTNFILVTAPFALWDARQIWLKAPRRPAPRAAHACLACVLALMIWFRAAPRVNPLSTYVPYSSDWWPIKPSSVGYLLFSSISMSYGVSHPALADPDFYVTHHMLFGPHGDTFLGALKANPKIIAWHLGKNTADIFPAMIQLTQFYPIFRALQGPPQWVREWKFVLRQHDWSHFLPGVQGLLAHLAAPMIVLVFLWGAWLAAEEESTKLFIVGSALAPLPAILVWPHSRYQFPLLPVFLLAGVGFGRLLARRLADRRAAAWAVPLMIFLMSSGAGWGQIASDIASSAREGRFVVLQGRQDSIWPAHDQLSSLSAQCRGLITLECTYFDSYTAAPLSRIHDVLEIPPFGRYGDGAYQGLTPDRVDCLFMSKELMEGTGIFQNYGTRYNNYVKPYAEVLKARGERVVAIPGYGQAVVP